MAYYRRVLIISPVLLATLYSAIWFILYIRHNISETEIVRNAPLLNAAAVMDNSAFLQGVRFLKKSSQNIVPTALAPPIMKFPISPSLTSRYLWTTDDFECIAWRQTSNCNPYGPREYDRDIPCNETVRHVSSGFCEFRNKTSGEVHKVVSAHCGSTTEDFQCGDIAMEFANYKILANMKIRNPEKIQLSSNIEKPIQGIVIAAYKEVLINAFVNIRLIREHGCELPIELWFKIGELSLKDPLVIELVNQYNVTLRIIREDAIKKWLVKIYGIFYSHFDQVLLLDADNIPAVDPTYLFDLEEFHQFGAIFWPDYWRPGASIFGFNEHSLIWELLDIEPIRMFEQESGQVLIDRRKSAKALNLLLFYAYHFDIIEKLHLVWGDKDLFRLAWLKLKQPFHMIERPPGSAGLLLDELFCGLTMVQHDTKGNPVFFHRNTIKFNKDSGYIIRWTHLQQYVGVYDPMEFSVENTLRRYHPFGPFDCFGAYRYKTIKGTDGTLKFNVTEIAKTSFADLEYKAISFAQEGRRLSGEIA